MSDHAPNPSGGRGPGSTPGTTPGPTLGSPGTDDRFDAAVLEASRRMPWTRLVGVPRIALSPGTALLGVFGVVLLALADALSASAMPVPADGSAPQGMLAVLLDAVTDALQLVAEGVIQGQLHDLSAAADRMRAVIDAAAAAPFAALLAAIPGAAILAVFGTAIARLAAMDLARRTRIDWTEALGFGLARARTGAAALMLMPAVAAALSLLLAVSGWLLLTLPGVNLVGALLYGVMLVGGLLAAFLLIGSLLAGPLLLPAIASDEADTFDALQRSLAYLVAAPLKLAGYGLVAVVLGSLLALMLTVLAGTADWITSGSVWAFADPSGERVASFEDGSAESMWKIVGGAIQLWQGVLTLLVAGVLFAYACAAATCVYLLIRQSVDGQDFHEIAMPPPQPVEAASDRP